MICPLREGASSNDTKIGHTNTAKPPQRSKTLMGMRSERGKQSAPNAEGLRDSQGREHQVSPSYYRSLGGCYVYGMIKSEAMALHNREMQHPQKSTITAEVEAIPGMVRTEVRRLLRERVGVLAFDDYIVLCSDASRRVVEVRIFNGEGFASHIFIRL